MELYSIVVMSLVSDHDSSIDAGWNRASRIDHPKPAYVDDHGRGLSFSSIGFG